MRTILRGAALALLLIGCNSSDDNPRDDAGPMDAGGDAGGSDAGSDASRNDTGAPPGDAGQNDAGPGDAGDAGQSGDAGPGDAGMGDAGDDRRAILDRPSSGAYNCSVRRELLNYKPLSWGYAGSDLLNAGSDSAWAARVEAQEQGNPFDLGPAEFVLSKVDAAGVLGTRSEIAVADPSLVSKPIFLPLAAGAFGLIWIEGQGDTGEGEPQQTVRFAAFDAAGAVTVAPKTLLTESSDTFSTLVAARADSGEIGLVWSSPDQEGRPRTKLAVVDAAGAVVSAPRTLVERALPAAQIVSTGDGFAALWLSFDDAARTADVHFGRFSVRGEPDGSSVRLSTPGSVANLYGYGGSRLALLRVADELLAAWTEGSSGNDDFANPAGAYSVIRVARLDRAGAVLNSALLREKLENFDDEEPVLVPFGNDVALLWGRGEHIYICAGCVPDHTVEAVVLDPKTLTPRSNALKITPTQGGLLRKRVAASGSLLLSTVEITFHVHSEPGFVAFQCQSSS